MKQIVNKLNKIALAIDENVELPTSDLIIDSLDAITTAFGGTPNESNLIVDKLDDIASVAHGGGGGGVQEYVIKTLLNEQTFQGESVQEYISLTGDWWSTGVSTIDVVFDGVSYNNVPYDSEMGGYGTSEYDEEYDGQVPTFETYPFYVYPSPAIKVNDTNEHTISVIGNVLNAIEISENGYGIDVSQYYYANVGVYGSGTINITQPGNNNVEGYQQAYVVLDKYYIHTYTISAQMVTSTPYRKAYAMGLSIISDSTGVDVKLQATEIKTSEAVDITIPVIRPAGTPAPVFPLRFETSNVSYIITDIKHDGASIAFDGQNTSTALVNLTSRLARGTYEIYVSSTN